jgi:hypothetical protein
MSQHRVLKSTDTRKEKTYVCSIWAKPDSLVFLDRTGPRKIEDWPLSFNRLSPSMSLSTKNLLGKSSRDFTHRLYLVRFHLLLHHHECEPEDGSQMEEDERRMHQPYHHSQS